MNHGKSGSKARGGAFFFSSPTDSIQMAAASRIGARGQASGWCGGRYNSDLTEFARSVRPTGAVDPSPRLAAMSPKRKHVASGNEFVPKAPALFFGRSRAGTTEFGCGEAPPVSKKRSQAHMGMAFRGSIGQARRAAGLLAIALLGDTRIESAQVGRRRFACPKRENLAFGDESS